MNRRIPTTLEGSYTHSLPFEAVLAGTTVNKVKTAVTQLTAPGTHPIWLETPTGEIPCRVQVRLVADPAAPLLLYHHGLGEYPYDSSWRRLFGNGRTPQLPMQRVLIQAPYHTNFRDPLDKGFQSLQNMYQLFAASVRMMELMQHVFTEQGAAYTVAAGVSWGGITSLLYAAVTQQCRAVIPMLSSPNVGQAIWDIAELVARPLTISHAELLTHLDFTQYYHRLEQVAVYPLLGAQDLFFRQEHHAPLFAARPLRIVPGGHLSNLWLSTALREHLFAALTAVNGGNGSLNGY
jgi:pimeloyl-ACP methyl ester carboxylesterase